jgi:hypothetical protein
VIENDAVVGAVQALRGRRHAPRRARLPFMYGVTDFDNVDMDKFIHPEPF